MYRLLFGQQCLLPSRGILFRTVGRRIPCGGPPQYYIIPCACVCIGGVGWGRGRGSSLQSFSTLHFYADQWRRDTVKWVWFIKKIKKCQQHTSIPRNWKMRSSQHQEAHTQQTAEGFCKYIIKRWWFFMTWILTEAQQIELVNNKSPTRVSLVMARLHSACLSTLRDHLFYKLLKHTKVKPRALTSDQGAYQVTFDGHKPEEDWLHSLKGKFFRSKFWSKTSW